MAHPDTVAAHAGSRSAPRAVVAWRIAWTIGSLIAVQTIVCSVSALPALIWWRTLFVLAPSNPILRLVVFSTAIVPSYVLFALSLMVVSPLATRLLGWHTPPDAAMRIADCGWPLLGWVRYAASLHLVRLVAGTLFRATPIWTAYLRLHGARLGRRVYVNSLGVSDYNLLECGDDVVIGGGVHLSGHTVEAGIVKTAGIRFGDNVTIGLGSVIEIGVEIGSHAQVGALSFVPKYSKLAGGAVYTGIPVRPLDVPR